MKYLESTVMVNQINFEIFSYNHFEYRDWQNIVFVLIFFYLLED